MPNSGFAGFDDLIVAGGAAVDLAVTDREAMLSILSALAGRATGIEAALILERVRLRERLGSTGFGGGAAIPHARFTGLGGVVAVVAVASRGVDFAAIDDQPVDIAVLLLSPEAAGADHLKALARISRTLRDPARLMAMRAARSGDALRLAIAAEHEAPRRAA